MRNIFFRSLVTVTALTVAIPTFAQQVTFDKAKIRFQRSDTDRRLVYKDVDLIMDNQTRRLIVTSENGGARIGHRAAV